VDTNVHIFSIFAKIDKQMRFFFLYYQGHIPVRIIQLLPMYQTVSIPKGISAMQRMIIASFLLCVSLSIAAPKEVYIPKFITSTGMDLNKTSSQWCYSRSKETDNVVVFWESGFGSNPVNASGDYHVDVTNLLAVAEKSYSMYLDTLKFAIKGSSVTDRYKLLIFLLYSTEWAAYGSGQDNLVGSLQVNPAAANYSSVVAHEIGHCFEYITGCDSDGGYQYGFGANGSGGNGFWEQCAQWMSFKVYPEQQFTAGDFRTYIASNHLHILHETPRYANYFLMDYWTYKHDGTFMGKLWRDSRSPEDPVETYKRLNSLSQDQFNDEIYEHALRLTTWDLPALLSYGKNYIDSRAQVKMSLTTDNYWLVDPSVCIENYGYNSIKLNAPSQAAEVTVRFKGRVGASGFRSLNPAKGGWRFGFVALLKDGARKYSAVGTATMANAVNPDQALTFSCPANCSKLWLVVSGAPQEHWRHAWDDNNANDEHWPYQVQFVNTNLLGTATETVPTATNGSVVPKKPVTLKSVIYLPQKYAWRVTDLTGRQVMSGYGNSISMKRFSQSAYILMYSDRKIKISNVGGGL
jgi:hypothetical protein